MLFQIMVREGHTRWWYMSSLEWSEGGLDFQRKYWDSPRQTNRQWITLAQNTAGSLAACLHPPTQKISSLTSSKSLFQKHLLFEKLI